ncbi:XisH protein [Leptolyngbya sp. NIES-3755]|nr:XisH protein [Leptolyngbya sp. NIES-3755]
MVKTALEKEGWIITADPYEISIDDVDFEIDLAAEQLLAAEREGRSIAVEIKSFTSPSNVSDFHTALGQFLNYRDALGLIDPDRQLYLASANIRLRELLSTSIYSVFGQTLSIAVADL